MWDRGGNTHLRRLTYSRVVADHMGVAELLPFFQNQRISINQ